MSLEWNRDGVMHSESGDDELVRERSTHTCGAVLNQLSCQISGL